MSRPNNTPEEVIDRLLDGQRSFFATGATRDLKFRLQQLQKLRAAILRNEDAIADALRSDLHKSAEETWLTETSIVLQEIGAHLRHLRRWARPHSVASSLAILPSRSRILHEPTGVSLIIAPWNYPLQLLLNPLVGAISAGCCAVLKASPYAPATATVVERLVAETFDPRHVCLVQGNRDVNRALLARRFDHIFFTGSPELGKTVMQAAAANLTPVVLELGGKSPCIVARDANIALAARRIAWGKTINAGQTCIAPDYLFIHESVK
jgi:aldehyde dehydrogenase (NAD+)